ncbi:septum site-determining protein MinC [Luteimonas sp. FXH3W]|uniref:Probable septum site-determining protein MinC n=1 Tax=Aquilutibacter rugosus TaxID=3115820 RepID=A0ABU7V1B5_9GAMM
MSATPNYELAGELKIGQVGIANLRIQTLDIARLQAEMDDRVKRAPNLFGHAAIVLDFGALSEVPTVAQAQQLIDALRAAGTLPVAVAYGSSATEQLARALNLPILAKFRESFDPSRAGGAATAASAPVPAAAPAAAAAPAPAAPSNDQPGQIHATPIRSGQQIYAAGKDLTVLTSVGAGAEVISDGSIHIYGPLRGRAIAGAQGNENARIFCREFDAELVSIAGNYKVLEEVPQDMRGRPVQIWLQDGQLKFAVIE